MEEWINANKGTAVSRTTLNAAVNPDSESNTLENESSDEEDVKEKISSAEGAGACSTLLKFAKKDGHVTWHRR